LSVLTNRIRGSHLLDGGAGADELFARSNDPAVLASSSFERKSS
jgi:hypothetical protein